MEETPTTVVENDQAKLLWDFKTQTDKLVVANQPDVVVLDFLDKKAVVTDIGMTWYCNIWQKEHEKLEKHQRLREGLKKLCKVKATVVPVVIRALAAVLPNWVRGSSRETLM